MTSGQSRDFIHHSLLVLGSQLAVFASALVKALIVPLVLGVSDYGYWQLYVFYTIYVGIFSFGYNDGIYLKYGGHRFEELPLAKLRASNVMHVLLLILGVTVVVLGAGLVADPLRKIVFFAVAANIFVLGTIGNISLSLQAVGRMKGYAFLNAADKIFFTIALAALVYPELRTFSFLITIDLAGKIAVLIALILRYPQLYAGSFASMAAALLEFRENLRSGIQLMVANLSGMLVLGIGRIFIEYFESVENYSHYAFASSISNIMLMCITSMSVVIYPALRRQPDASYLRHFEKINNNYSSFSIILMTSYFAAIAFILQVATSYKPVLEFLNIVFAITVLQGKMQLVNNTFYVALRLERAMLRANLISLLFAIGLSTLGYMVTQSVVSIAYATLLTMLLRVYASEIFLRRQMAGIFSNGPLLEVAVLSGFLALTTFASPIAGCLAWCGVVVLVALKDRRQIAVAVHKVWNRGK
jgi:O-antigen/teichoic acid export membrane protein